MRVRSTSSLAGIKASNLAKLTGSLRISQFIVDLNAIDNGKIVHAVLHKLDESIMEISTDDRKVMVHGFALSRLSCV